MIPLIAYLKEKGIAALCSEFHVKADYSIIYPELVCLCYHHTKSPKNEITNDCRGIIVNKDTFEIICYPFRRFFDYNENMKTDFDFNSFYFAEKVDGSLCNVWFYDGTWNVSTKSSADASGMIKYIGMSYADYFWQVWGNKKYEYDLDRDFTHMFEFKFPSDTQFITQAKTESITLIGRRNNETLQEFGVMTENICNDFETLKQIVNSMNPVTCEGYVLVDENFNRLKLKSPAYDLLALLKKGDENYAHNKEILIKVSKYFDRFHIDFNKFLQDRYDLKETFVVIIRAKRYLLNNLKDALEDVGDLEGKELGLYAKDSYLKKVLFTLKKLGDEFKLLEQISMNIYIELIKANL